MTDLATPLPSTRSGEPLSEEAAWVRAAQSGDEDGMLRLLARYRPALVRLLSSVLGDLAAAEDAAQEAFLNAFRRLSQLRDPERFYPWVRRTAVRMALKTARHGARTETYEEASELPGPDAIGGVETRLMVHAVLRQMPPDLRTALVLRELEGLEYAEIAQLLEIPIGTVRSRPFAARERFRGMWEA